MALRISRSASAAQSAPIQHRATHLNRAGLAAPRPYRHTLTAWAYAGAGEGKRALEIADKLKGERTYTRLPCLPCGPDCRARWEHVEAERRLKQLTRRTLDIAHRRPTHASNRVAAARTRPCGLHGFRSLLPRHPLVGDAPRSTPGGQDLGAARDIAQEGAAEVLYG